jgi:hypothetical protein
MYLNEIEDPEKQQEELRQAAERLSWHSLEITSKAGSGHPTSCLSCAEIDSDQKGRGVSSIEGEEEGSHGKPAPSLKDALSELDKTAMEKERSLPSPPKPRKG